MGRLHLLDFGIAKLLQEGIPHEPGLTQQQGRVMTPHYASPEQVAGEAITVQSDVYSLGVLLYELLTGLLPIAPKRSTLGAVEEAILQGDVPLASSRGQGQVHGTGAAWRGRRHPGQGHAARTRRALRHGRSHGAGCRAALGRRDGRSAARQLWLPIAQAGAAALGRVRPASRLCLPSWSVAWPLPFSHSGSRVRLNENAP